MNTKLNIPNMLKYSKTLMAIVDDSMDINVIIKEAKKCGKPIWITVSTDKIEEFCQQQGQEAVADRRTGIHAPRMKGAFQFNELNAASNVGNFAQDRSTDHPQPKSVPTDIAFVAKHHGAEFLPITKGT